MLLPVWSAVTAGSIKTVSDAIRVIVIKKTRMERLLRIVDDIVKLFIGRHGSARTRAAVGESV